MGLTLQEKEEIRRKVAEGPQPRPAQRAEPVMIAACATVVPSDELIIEVTGNGAAASVTLRPAEVSRLRSRHGKGPGFEQWVAARVRDAMISFGGG